MAYGLWLMAYGLWLMAYGLWLMAYGKIKIYSIPGLLSALGKLENRTVSPLVKESIYIEYHLGIK